MTATDVTSNATLNDKSLQSLQHTAAVYSMLLSTKLPTMAWLWTVALFAVAFAAAPEDRLKRSIVLGKEGRFKVEWGLGDQEDIFFRVEVKTLGYVSLGFSADGTMKDSDMMVGWVANGKVYLQDRYAEGNRMPDLDDHQDWELISGSENDTHTSLFVRRKLNTCDAQDFALEYDNTIRLMHAYSFEDPIDEFTIPYPRNREWKSLMLLQPVFAKETEVEFWDVLTSDFSVSPEWDTLYWCKFIKGPELTQKHHITTVETMILEGNIDYVHHVLVLECAGGTAEEFDPYLTADGFDCYGGDKSPRILGKCDGNFAGWGRGGSTLVMPDHVGMPLESQPKYYMLEVHYDNYKRDTGRPGRAGFRFHHTPKLRQFDAGLHMTGTFNAANIIIPPGVKNFVVTGHGSTECTANAIPEGGVNFINVLLHTHLLGSRMKLRHFRDNIELPTLAYNKHYDPDLQEYSVFRREVKFQKNDQLTLECTFDSTRTNQTTFGGLSTREEMCSGFMIYYPIMKNVYASVSVLRKSSYTESMDLRGLSGSSDEEVDKAFVQFMTTYDWNRTSIRRLERGLRYSQQDSICFIGNGNLDTVNSLISYPPNLQEYVEPPSVCAAKGIGR